jgi:hypothetical protein
MYDRGVRRSREPSSGTAGVRQPPVDAITRLQQTAGNRAVATLVMRLGTGEHAQLGGNRQVTINGVTMTEGELLTLGDLYKNPTRVYQAPKAELENIVGLIRQDVKYRQNVPGAAKVSDDQWEKATAAHAKDETYEQLAAANDTHFAPPAKATGQGDHRSEWERYHREATVEARVAALGGAKTVPEKAVVLNGFAGHFLTDAFSAGHLRAKSAIMDYARATFEDLGDQTWLNIFSENDFTIAVAGKLLADPGLGPLLRSHQIRIVEWDDMSVTKLSELIYGLQDEEPQIFYSLFAGIVHDRLNDAIEKNDKAGLPDIWVVNERGDGPWSLPGDGNLARSPDTIRIAKAAVEEAYRNLELAVADPRGFDVEKAVKRVWAYVPKPTPHADLLISGVIAKYADVRTPETQQAAADYIIANQKSVIGKLVDRNRLRLPPKSSPHPRPRFVR